MSGNTAAAVVARGSGMFEDVAPDRNCSSQTRSVDAPNESEDGHRCEFEDHSRGNEAFSLTQKLINFHWTADIARAFQAAPRPMDKPLQKRVTQTKQLS